MPYYKRETETATLYYNTELDPVTMLVETDKVYEDRGADHDAEWLEENAERIYQYEFDEKADNVSAHLRLGLHPPCPPGGC